jgi:hypothetical protein
MHGCCRGGFKVALQLESRFLAVVSACSGVFEIKHNKLIE